MVEARYEGFLNLHLRVGKIRHSGRSFYDHLKGTHDLLRDWGNTQPVCLAGLFHSIYGTQYFRHQALAFHKRHYLQDLIGSEAERLAYVFCVSQRPTAWFANMGKPRAFIKDTHTDRLMELTQAELNSLLEIEAANLIEQGGGPVKVLRRLAESDISSSAKAAIGRLIC